LRTRIADLKVPAFYVKGIPCPVDDDWGRFWWLWQPDPSTFSLPYSQIADL